MTLVTRHARPVIAAALVLTLFNLLVFAAGEAPWRALVTGLEGSLGTAYGLGQVLYKATSLAIAGAAFQVAYRAGLFNVGIEGQIALAALAAGVVGARLGWAPAWIAVPVAGGAAVGVAAGWAALAGWLRVRFGAHEVITTILQNRLADALLPLALAHGLGETGVRTRDVAASAAIPRLSVLSHALAGSAASFAVLLALVTPWLIDRWERRAKVGREVGLVGLGPEACRAAGVPVSSRLLVALTLSGAVAGLTACGAVLGYKGHYELGMTTGVGFAGIAVGLLGRGTPLGLLAAALLVGALQQTGLVLNATVPKEATDVLFGAVILAVATTGRREVTR
ncbi:MAG: ABC transporter permease [Polyangiaceae bacterium]|nr:ABC transporter permease [Polyangiaceae bacterium]